MSPSPATVVDPAEEPPDAPQHAVPVTAQNRSDHVAAHPHHEGADDALPAMPDPEPLLRNLARCGMEAMAGARDLEQMARWVSDAAYKHLLTRVVMAARAREVLGRTARRPNLATGKVIVSEPRAGIVEAVVIVHEPGRTRAVAIRLEAVGARWRASAINIL